MEHEQILIKNTPNNYQNYNVNIDNNNYYKRKNDNYLNEKSELFWNKYYSIEDYSFNISQIKVYDNIIPDDIASKLARFARRDFNWLYGYKNNIETTFTNYNYDSESDYQIDDTILKNNELLCFYGNVLKNKYFELLFYNIILPNIDIENKENIKIDRAHIIGRLHNLSEFFHKDERSTIKYAPSVYVYLNDDWKTYHEGTLSFLLDIENVDIHYIQNKLGRIIMFPPNMLHKTSEISSYGLFENKMSFILEYHLIYN